MIRHALVFVALSACCATQEDPAAEPAASPEPEAVAEPAAEEEPVVEIQSARVIGEAANAKGGAVVVLSNGPVYVAGLDEWPAELLGQKVVVEGAVADEKLIPDPVTEDGEIAQGAWGTQRVISHATWELAD